jgi:hypothetical protein
MLGGIMKTSIRLIAEYYNVETGEVIEAQELRKASST